jgi:hypothetical protein
MRKDFLENRLNTQKDDQTGLNPIILQLKRPKSPPEESKQIVLKKPRNIETVKLFYSKSLEHKD